MTWVHEQHQGAKRMSVFIESCFFVGGQLAHHVVGRR